MFVLAVLMGMVMTVGVGVLMVGRMLEVIVAIVAMMTATATKRMMMLLFLGRVRSPTC